MQVRIGVQSVPKEVVVETSMTPEEVEQTLTDALADGSLFVLRNGRGSRVVVPADKLAYLEIGESEVKSVGFSSF